MKSQIISSVLAAAFASSAMAKRGPQPPQGPFVGCRIISDDDDVSGGMRFITQDRVIKHFGGASGLTYDENDAANNFHYIEVYDRVDGFDN